MYSKINNKICARYDELFYDAENPRQVFEHGKTSLAQNWT